MLAHAYVLIQHMPTIVDDDMFSRLLIVSLLLFVYTQVGPMVPGCAHKYIYIYIYTVYYIYCIYIYSIYTIYIYMYTVYIYIYCIIYIYIYIVFKLLLMTPRLRLVTPPGQPGPSCSWGILHRFCHGAVLGYSLVSKHGRLRCPLCSRKNNLCTYQCLYIYTHVL